MACLHHSIQLHFELGLRHGEIRNLLSTVNDVNIMMHAVRRTLKCIEREEILTVVNPHLEPRRSSPGAAERSSVGHMPVGDV